MWARRSPASPVPTLGETMGTWASGTLFTMRSEPHRRQTVRSRMRLLTSSINVTPYGFDQFHVTQGDLPRGQRRNVVYQGVDKSCRLPLEAPAAAGLDRLALDAGAKIVKFDVAYAIYRHRGRDRQGDPSAFEQKLRSLEPATRLRHRNLENYRNICPTHDRGDGPVGAGQGRADLKGPGKEITDQIDV